MLKKTIPYIDLNGVERKEDFYFHLSCLLYTSDAADEL